MAGTIRETGFGSQTAPLVAPTVAAALVKGFVVLQLL